MQDTIRTTHSLGDFEDTYNKKIKQVLVKYRANHIIARITFWVSGIFITTHLLVGLLVDSNATGVLKWFYTNNRTILHISLATFIASILMFVSSYMSYRKLTDLLEGKNIVESLIFYALREHFKEATVNTKPVRVLAIKSSQPLEDGSEVLVTSFIHTNKENIEAKHLMRKKDEKMFTIEFIEGEKIGG